MFRIRAKSILTPYTTLSRSDLSDGDSYLGDDPTVTALCGDAGIALVKTRTRLMYRNTGSANPAVGVQITYAFSVKNTGNVTLSNVSVADLVAGVTVVGGPVA